MRNSLFLIALLLTGCREDRPPAPSAEENRQLDEAEAMLDQQVHEKGPASASAPADPDSNQD